MEVTIGIKALIFYNNWCQCERLMKDDMSKIGSSTIKFEVENFNGKENFNL